MLRKEFIYKLMPISNMKHSEKELSYPPPQSFQVILPQTFNDDSEFYIIISKMKPSES